MADEVTFDEMTPVDIPPKVQSRLDEVFHGHETKVYRDPYCPGDFLLIIRRPGRTAHCDMKWDNEYAAMLLNSTAAFRKGIAEPCMAALEGK